MIWKRNSEWQRLVPGAWDSPLSIPGAWDSPLSVAPVCWEKGDLAAIVSRDEITPGDARWHISLQHRLRVPTWNELAEAAHALRPGVPFVIGVPPKSQWINVHERVLHLFELKDQGLIDQWRFEGRGDIPT